MKGWDFCFQYECGLLDYLRIVARVT